MMIPPRPVVAPRGPAVKPLGYNTYQPRVFRARPRPFGRPIPMMPPHPRGLRHPMAPPRMVYGYGPVFRNRPRSASYDAKNEEYADENECQYTDVCETNVCTKCGKEF